MLTHDTRFSIHLVGYSHHSECTRISRRESAAVAAETQLVGNDRMLTRQTALAFGSREVTSSGKVLMQSSVSSVHSERIHINSLLDSNGMSMVQVALESKMAHQLPTKVT